MPSDRKLLDEFNRSRSEEAFRALVERHIDLVHSVARRVTLNDDLARDVSQAVFLKLATRPGDVPQGLKLLAWLHRTTRHKAIDLVRSENRRRRREASAIQQQQIDMDSQDELDWKELEPILDGALEKLSANDRSLILSRYYKRNSHSITARELGISEDAVRMRTRRALGKLRSSLGKRGIATTAALLASTVSTNAVGPAPESLAAAISSATLKAAETATSSPLLALSKAKVATLATIALCVPIIVVQFNQHRQLEKRASQLQASLAELERRTTSKPSLTAKLTRLRPQHAGLNLTQILAIPDPQRRLHLLLEFANEIGAQQIPDAILELGDGTPHWDQDAKITSQALYTRWARSDINGALRHLEELDYGVAGDEITFVIATLASEDPQRAIAWLNQPDNKLSHLPGMSHRLAGSISKEWARRDPESALSWALSLGQSQRAGAMNGALGTIATTRPEQVEMAVQKWHDQNPTEAEQYDQTQ